MTESVSGFRLFFSEYRSAFLQTAKSLLAVSKLATAKWKSLTVEEREAYENRARSGEAPLPAEAIKARATQVRPPRVKEVPVQPKKRRTPSGGRKAESPEATKQPDIQGTEGAAVAQAGNMKARIRHPRVKPKTSPTASKTGGEQEGPATTEGRPAGKAVAPTLGDQTQSSKRKSKSSVEQSAQATELVRQYIQDKPTTWTFRRLLQELCAAKGWQRKDQLVIMRLRSALRSLGYTGSCALVPQLYAPEEDDVRDAPPATESAAVN